MGYAERKSSVVEMEDIECCNCGIRFWVPANWESKRREDKNNFYCPNGHTLRFLGETEAEKYKRLYEGEVESRQKEFIARNKAENNLRRLKKRVACGVCPECKRSFTNLRRHMETKHGGENAESRRAESPEGQAT